MTPLVVAAVAAGLLLALGYFVGWEIGFHRARTIQRDFEVAQHLRAAARRAERP